MQSDILSMNPQLPALANSKPPLEERSGASKSTLIFLPLSRFDALRRKLLFFLANLEIMSYFVHEEAI